MTRLMLSSLAAAAIFAMAAGSAVSAEATKKPVMATTKNSAPVASMKSRQPAVKCDCTNCSAPHCGPGPSVRSFTILRPLAVDRDKKKLRAK